METKQRTVSEQRNRGWNSELLWHMKFEGQVIRKEGVAQKESPKSAWGSPGVFVWFGFFT